MPAGAPVTSALRVAVHKSGPLGTAGDCCRYGSYWFRCFRGGCRGWRLSSSLTSRWSGCVRTPDIGREELIRFFTLTRKDLGFVDNLERGGGRGPAARLGLAVQLCTLPWLGFVPDDIWSVPQAAVLRLADQLGVFPGVLGQYGGGRRLAATT